MAEGALIDASLNEGIHLIRFGPVLFVAPGCPPVLPKNPNHAGDVISPYPENEI